MTILEFLSIGFMGSSIGNCMRRSISPAVFLALDCHYT